MNNVALPALGAYEKYAGFASLVTTLNPIQWRYIFSPAPIRANFKANQAGGTAASALDAAMRFLRIHPVAKRNILNKPVRFVSKVKPKQEGDEENQQYVELLKLVPAYLIKKDVTARCATMTIRDPLGGSDNKAEFMSSSQELDAFFSVQRSALYQDEEIERVKWDESLIRLLKEDGDATITLTPAKGLDWVYDSIWRRASTIYRSDTICKKYGFPAIEDTGHKSNIEVFCWATDDNPILSKEAIERLFENIDDPDVIAMRRYGIFKQVSGRIYKSFNKQVHVLKSEDYFNADVFRSYWNYRIIDYHPSKPWDVSFVVCTPRNEWIVWNELHQSHDNRTTTELRDEIKRESLLEEDHEYNRATPIDPLATVKQPNTGYSPFDDLAMGDAGLRRLTPADTKNTGGQLNIKMRLKNALECGKPENNLIGRGEAEDPRYGLYKPTLWFLDRCERHIDHFMNWREREYKAEHLKETKTIKPRIEKYSDFCRNLEFLGALNPAWYDMPNEVPFWEQREKQWFNGHREARA